MTLWLEDLTSGGEYITAARQLTETDLVTFSMLSGDWNPIHNDHDHAVAAGLPGRVLHGVLGLAVLTGQVDRAGWFAESAVAMLSIEEWTFTAPIVIGAVVHTEMRIGEVRRSASRPDAGIVQRHFRLVERTQGVLQHGRIPVLVAARPHRNDRDARAPW